MIKVLIFDFDGVIVDTEKIYFVTLQNILKEEGFEIPDDAFPKKIGKITSDFLEEVLGDKAKTINIEEVIEKRKILFFENFKEYIKPIPGVEDFLKAMKEKGYTLAIGSSNNINFISKVLDHLGIRDLFSLIVSADDVNNIKPDPETYQRILDTFNINSNECLVFEDSLRGIEPAKHLNIKVVALATSHPREIFKDVNLVINNFNNKDEIENFLSSLKS